MSAKYLRRICPILVEIFQSGWMSCLTKIVKSKFDSWMNRRVAPVFTWLIILAGAEVERSLGALQPHLSPVRDSLQLHSVAVVLLKSLQIHPALSLRQHKTLGCWRVCSLPHCHSSLPSEPRHCPARGSSSQPGPNSGLWESLTYWEHMWCWGRHRGEEIAFRASWGSRVIRASQGFLAVFDLQHSTISVSLMSSCYWLCVFWHSSASRLLLNPQGAKVETSSTCINRCLVSPTSISPEPHLQRISKTNSGEDFIEVCVHCLDNMSFSSAL